MLLPTIAEVMIQLNFFNEIDACPRFTCSIVYKSVHKYAFSFIHIRTGILFYIMVERHFYMYIYNNYIDFVIVLSKDNFLKISRSFLSLFLFKVRKQAEKKAMNFFRKSTKEMIILEWKQFSIQIMQLCTTLKRMIKY